MKTVIKYLLTVCVLLVAGYGQLAAHTDQAGTDTSYKRPVKSSVAVEPGCSERFFFAAGTPDEEKHIFHIKESFIENESNENEEEEDELTSAKKRLQGDHFIFTYVRQASPGIFGSHQGYPVDLELFSRSSASLYLLIRVLRI